MLQKVYIFSLILLLIITSTGITIHYHQCIVNGLQSASFFENNICVHKHIDNSDNSSKDYANICHCVLSHLNSCFNLVIIEKCNLDYPNNPYSPEFKALCCSEYSKLYIVGDLFQIQKQKIIHNLLYFYKNYTNIIDPVKNVKESKIKFLPPKIYLDFRDLIIAYIQKSSNFSNPDAPDFNNC